MKRMSSDIDLQVVVPCYNEEDAVAKFYIRLRNIVKKYNYSILFIDDGSNDHTFAEIQALSARDARVSYIRFSRNFGQQNALKAGYDNSAHADCVVTMDGDLQHPPELIDKLVQKWLEGYDIVNTIRSAKDPTPFWRRITAKWFYWLVNFISNTKIIPNGPDYRLLDRNVIRAIGSMNENNIYWKELIPWIGFKQCQVQVEVEKRVAGKSKYSFFKQVSTSMRAITSFSINPLRFASFAGVLSALLAFLYGIYSLYVYFFTDNAVPGWTSLIASILFIAGIQFILIGIIGEYLGRTFLETKKRPLYIVKEYRKVSFCQRSKLRSGKVGSNIFS